MPNSSVMLSFDFSDAGDPTQVEYPDDDRDEEAADDGEADGEWDMISPPGSSRNGELLDVYKEDAPVPTDT